MIKIIMYEEQSKIKLQVYTKQCEEQYFNFVMKLH